jgi:hypothetical protein
MSGIEEDVKSSKCETELVAEQMALLQKDIRIPTTTHGVVPQVNKRDF